ncbi:MAG TPA: type II toxin-antitoxin system RelE/ParE family toxin [Actinobacteria bacterium]|nr:type II toxin-antitoxin system RelE/ParE family toxin [Actinomycetes bacterium]HEX21656.1 type II toxin-antitoxin system RelE/ParE family toxin [Actinomycetota bacterium]
MKNFRVEWSQSANKDLINILEYVSQDDFDTAIRVFKAIKSKCTTLNQFPDRGRHVPELKAYGIFSYRELLIAPWRVIYRISDNKVFVLAIIDSRRNIEDILIERFLD